MVNTVNYHQGYYEEGGFGIRIEDVVEVVETKLGPEDARWVSLNGNLPEFCSFAKLLPNVKRFTLLNVGKIAECNSINAPRFLRFETISYVPMDRRLINTELMDGAQVRWLNQYHVIAREKVGEVLERKGKSEELKKWLVHHTQPL